MRRGSICALLCCCLLLSGCYLIQAAQGQASVMSKRQPIPKVVADPATPPWPEHAPDPVAVLVVPSLHLTLFAAWA